MKVVIALAHSHSMAKVVNFTGHIPHAFLLTDVAAKVRYGIKVGFLKASGHATHLAPFRSV
jgi:hypothetical protein